MCGVKHSDRRGGGAHITSMLDLDRENLASFARAVELGYGGVVIRHEVPEGLHCMVS